MVLFLLKNSITMTYINMRCITWIVLNMKCAVHLIALCVLVLSVDSVYSEATCEDLPVVINGFLIHEENVETFRVNDTIRYECNPGYLSKETDPKVICLQQNNSTFWDQGGGCIRTVSCNDPGDVENANRVGNVFTFPFNVTYKCKEGFKMIGSGVKFCSKTGKWQPPSIPSCEAIHCPLLPDPLHGKVLLTSKTNFNSIATFKCNRYHNLVGSSVLICQNDETWNGTSPTCEAITCPDPGKLPNGAVISANRSVHYASSIVIFRCNDGMHVQTSKCLESGEWSVPPPICPEVDDKEPVVTTAKPITEEPAKKVDSCEDPGKIKNGDRVFISLHINSTVTYTCDEGYELRGKAVLLCLETGKWDLEKLPICVKPVSVPTVIGIVFGIIAVLSIIGGYLWYKYRVKRIRGYGEKSKALTADATDLEEITGLDRDKKPIPVTVL